VADSSPPSGAPVVLTVRWGRGRLIAEPQSGGRGWSQRVS